MAEMMFATCIDMHKAADGTAVPAGGIVAVTRCEQPGAVNILLLPDLMPYICYLGTANQLRT